MDISSNSIADAILHRFAEANATPIPGGQFALVVAHPDDETIGIGAQIPRLDGMTLVHLTDGSPRNPGIRPKAFPDWKGYADTRRSELDHALALADVRATRNALDLPDQEALNHLPDITRLLVDLFRTREITVALTHAYEGGHPDHDSAAFSVRAAARLLEREGQSVAILEMPLYRIGETGGTTQDFAPDPDHPETTIMLPPDRLTLKRAMLDAHESQRSVTDHFILDIERFRPAPAYDFTALPNGGQLLYERLGWGNGADWQRATRAALEVLGLVP